VMSVMLACDWGQGMSQEVEKKEGAGYGEYEGECGSRGG
jgi:hypothetical protein